MGDINLPNCMAFSFYAMGILSSDKNNNDEEKTNRLRNFGTYHNSMNSSTISGDPSLKSSTAIEPFEVWMIYSEDYKFSCTKMILEKKQTNTHTC